MWSKDAISVRYGGIMYRAFLVPAGVWLDIEEHGLFSLESDVKYLMQQHDDF